MWAADMLHVFRVILRLNKKSKVPEVFAQNFIETGEDLFLELPVLEDQDIDELKDSGLTIVERRKLKRLRAWIHAHPGDCHWQSLDSRIMDGGNQQQTHVPGDTEAWTPREGTGGSEVRATS